MRSTKKASSKVSAKAKQSDTKQAPKSSSVVTEPKFPYTNKPGSLRKLLALVPSKPRPTKFDKDLLKAWGFGDSNDYSIVRVLKAVGLLNDKNEPTEIYTKFMNLTSGASALAPELRRVYAPMFGASHAPYNEDAAALRNMFNIHSGGGDRSLDYQVLTFKTLCEFANFDLH